MRIVVLETLWQLETFAAEEAEVGREITINDLRRKNTDHGIMRWEQQPLPHCLLKKNNEVRLSAALHTACLYKMNFQEKNFQF